MVRIRIVMRITDIYSLRSPIEGKVIEQWYNSSFKNQSHKHLDFHVQSDAFSIGWNLGIPINSIWELWEFLIPLEANDGNSINPTWETLEIHKFWISKTGKL